MVPSYFTLPPGERPIDLSRKNAPIYVFAALSVFCAPVCLVSISLAAYRLAKRRPFALRGLIVAVVAAGIGVYVTALAMQQLKGGHWPFFSR
jgi:hypothetical protein